mmetsp:Transcript_974/g.2086  ORF Transcript_974/g.2086 Transcript_974/m.2086 type:complete len:125 (-) Transcript_974:307-681(-)
MGFSFESVHAAIERCGGDTRRAEQELLLNALGSQGGTPPAPAARGQGPGRGSSACGSNGGAVACGVGNGNGELAAPVLPPPPLPTTTLPTTSLPPTTLPLTALPSGPPGQAAGADKGLLILDVD